MYCVWKLKFFYRVVTSAGWFVCVRMLVGYIDSLSQKGMSLHPVCVMVGMDTFVWDVSRAHDDISRQKTMMSSCALGCVQRDYNQDICKPRTQGCLWERHWLKCSANKTQIGNSFESLAWVANLVEWTRMQFTVLRRCFFQGIGRHFNALKWLSQRADFKH